MPSTRKQINVRVDDETEELMRALVPAVSAAIGLSIGQSDLFRLGLLELKKKYLPDTPNTPPVPLPTATGRTAKQSRKER